MSDGWCWLALVDAPAPDADGCAAVRVAGPGGAPAGHLALWRRHAKPVRDARRVDGRLLDPAGAPALVSLVRPPAGAALAFDDLAVQHARRRVLAEAPFDAVSTLLRDASHFEGAITVARGADQRRRLPDDPFARVFGGALLLEVEAGALGTVPAPAGPVIERYGSAQPWPWDRF